MRRRAAAAVAPVLILRRLCIATAASAADRIRIAAQKTGTLAWELDIIKAHGLDKKADLDIQAIELATHRGRQDRAAQRLRRHDRVGLALGGARARARRRTSCSIPIRARSARVMVPANSPIAGRRRSQGQEARGRRRPDRQELAAAAGARAPRRPRSQDAGDDRLRRAAAAVAEGAAGRERRHADVLEFLRRAGRQGLQARRSTWTTSMKQPRRRRARSRCSAMCSTAAGRPRTSPRSTASSMSPRQAKDILAGSEAEWQRLAPRIGVTDKAGARALPAALQRGHSAPSGRRRGGRRARALPRAGRDRRRRSGRPGPRARRAAPSTDPGKTD